MNYIVEKPYYLVDNTKNKANRLLIKYCEVASKIFLFKGRKSLNNDVLREMWNDNKFPSPSYTTIIHKISVPNVKWYINNCLKIKGHIWNGDFVAGLTAFGKVYWSKREFPSFSWSRNRHLHDIISESPFYGRIYYSKKVERNGHRKCTWSCVPALYLPNSKDSISFMAGVLATGQQRYIDGESYIRYNHQILPYLKQWSIPVEMNKHNGVYISPIWPSLLLYLMPEQCKVWSKLPNACNVDFYAAILWTVYVGNKTIARGRIPYLKSRQWTYDNKGTVKKLKDFWVEKKLAGLDKRIKEAIHHWAKTV